MSYVTENYYTEVFHGEPVADTDFLSLLCRAQEIVEEMCLYRVSEDNIDTFSKDTQERFKKAVCAEIEYLDTNGGSDMDNGADLQSAGLGKFNYTKATGVNGGTQQSVYAPRALRLLTPTGLLYRGGGRY